ncbi:MAG: ABC transporter ATP-binding protein [Solirubrobacterales bacterium]|nr:ABC transporter ATP-binding protein [Solirubrobacterales bacterium]
MATDTPSAGEAAELALELRGITKIYGSLAANDAVDFDLRKGEIHALLGENGAGKSTLMNVVYGMARPDAGEIRIFGEPATIRSPRDAMAHGIGMVFQHFMLIPVMTVAENLVLGVSVGMQQRIEILRALDRGAGIIVLDEPTAVLTPQEAAELEGVLRRLRDEGTAIVFITHKLHEVLEVADRVTVLRRGKSVGTVPTEGASEASLARLMVGRDVVLQIDKPAAKPGPVALEVQDLHVFDDRHLEAVKGISLEVRRGEIVAIAGVDGNGQAELIDAITGLRHPESGHVVVDGRDITGCNPREARDAGVCHIAQDRHRRGLVLDFTIAENLALRDYGEGAKMGLLSPGRMLAKAKQLIEQFDIRGGTPDTPARSLSGGNQQKCVVAREIAGDPNVMIAAQPTRGLDVGAIEFVHRRLLAERDGGKAVLLFSLELEEVRALADRILVIYEGRIVAELPPTATDEQLGLLMTGGSAEAPAP